jgi:hypothetical protein
MGVMGSWGKVSARFCVDGDSFEPSGEPIALERRTHELNLGGMTGGPQRGLGRARRICF